MIKELISNYRICRGEKNLILKVWLFIRLCLADLDMWLDANEKIVWRAFVAFLILAAFVEIWIQWWRIAVFYRYITKGY
jgi:hypothetical protein